MQTRSPRPDPHRRLAQLKVAVLSLTGALLATLTWLVAGHPAGSTAAADRAAPAAVSVPRQQNDDDEWLFGDGSSSLSNAGTSQPLMHSAGS
ncbi:MAG TPA: hypothetical protein VFM74_02950 [Candidatus Limnocylindria bacterium]|nr:hypothetical protein [Candidatus Limnocylindria bacterium]